jgi:hypothetical protein
MVALKLYYISLTILINFILHIDMFVYEQINYENCYSGRRIGNETY